MPMRSSLANADTRKVGVSPTPTTIGVECRHFPEKYCEAFWPSLDRFQIVNSRVIEKCCQTIISWYARKRALSNGNLCCFCLVPRTEQKQHKLLFNTQTQ